MPLSSDISDFTRRNLTFAASTKAVFTTGHTGPAIVLMPEIYGFTPHLARFARWIRDLAIADCSRGLSCPQYLPTYRQSSARLASYRPMIYFVGGT